MTKDGWKYLYSDYTYRDFRKFFLNICDISFAKQEKVNKKLNTKFLFIIFNKICLQENLQPKYILLWTRRMSEHANVYLSHKIFLHLLVDLLKHIKNKRMRQKSLKW